MGKDCQRGNGHQCLCPACREHPFSRSARRHRLINHLLRTADERIRRLLAGLFATLWGRGGISQVARISGLDRKTIAKGQKELVHARKTGRVRRPGGGRKRREVHCPGPNGPCWNSSRTTRPGIPSRV